MQHNTAESAFVILNSIVTGRLTKKIENQLSIHGLSFTEYLIMHYLHGSPKMTMRRIDLAQNVGISASGVTRLLAPMAKIKLVEKEANPRDARVSLVKLSAAGKRLYSDATVSFEQAAQAALEPVTSSQLDKLTELSRRLV